jgi:hypothetical protein
MFTTNWDSNVSDRTLVGFKVRWVAAALVFFAEHYFGRIWRLIGETGFPNQIFNDSWMVGFWRADHGEHEVEVGKRSRAQSATRSIDNSLGDIH